MAGTEEFKLGYEVCLENAELWLNEGNTLWQNGSYGHASALYIHGLEGLIHAWFTWLVYIGAMEPTNKDFLDSFKSHVPKLQSFWGFIIGQQIEWDKITVEPDFLEKEDTWKQLEKEIQDFSININELVRDLMRFRNLAIYVNYVPKEQKFVSPLRLTQDDAGKLFFEIQNVYKRILFFIRDSDEKTRSDLRKVFQSFYSLRG